MTPQDTAKRAAALAAVAEVQDGMILGVGTGSTVAFLIEALGARYRDGMRFTVLPTSVASRRALLAAGIPSGNPAFFAATDLTIDGADEIDGDLRAIKGAGGAMLREKCVAASAARMLVIADGSKRVAQLGAAPVPCETLPFAHSFVGRALEEAGATVTLRRKDGALYRTDQDNLVFDCHFGLLEDPEGLAARLSSIPGMVGHGLFVGEIDGLWLAENGSATFTPRPGGS